MGKSRTENCPVCGSRMSEVPIMNDDGRNGYMPFCEDCGYPRFKKAAA